MSRTQRAADNSILNLLAWAWPLVLNLLLIRYAVRHLGEQGYGVYAFLLASLGSCIFLDLGLPAACVKYISAMYAERDFSHVSRVIGTGITVYGLLGALGALAVWQVAPWLLAAAKGTPEHLKEPARLTFYLASASFLVTLLSNLTASVPLALQRYAINTRIVLASNTVATAAGLAALHAGRGIAALAATSLLGALLSLALNIHFARRLLPELRWCPAFDLHYLRRLMGFGLFASLNNISSGVLWNLDRLLIGSHFGNAAVFFYTPPAQLANRVHGIASSLTNVVFPMTSEMIACGDTDSLRRLYLRAMRLTAAACTAIAVPLMVLSGPILRVWLGPEFATRSAPVLTVLVASFYLASFTAVPFHVYNGLGRPYMNTLFSFAVAGANAILCFTLIPRYGLMGGAWASLCSMGAVPFLNRILELRYLKVCSRSMITDTYVPVWCTGAAQAVLLWWLARAAAPAGPGVLAALMLGVLLFPALYFLSGAAPQEDRDLVGLYLNRLLGLRRPMAEPAVLPSRNGDGEPVGQVAASERPGSSV